MYVQEVLRSAGISFEPFVPRGAGKPIYGVYLTHANQLIGTYLDLRRVNSLVKDYAGWQAHHVVETVDWNRLGVTKRVPPRESNLCVLLPEAAHIRRINSRLRHFNPIHLSVDRSQLDEAYADAYQLVGNYCGSSEAEIRKELVGIVAASFRFAGVH